jgi:hypothetical protein
MHCTVASWGQRHLRGKRFHGNSVSRNPELPCTKSGTELGTHQPRTASIPDLYCPGTHHRLWLWDTPSDEVRRGVCCESMKLTILLSTRVMRAPRRCSESTARRFTAFSGGSPPQKCQRATRLAGTGRAAVELLRGQRHHGRTTWASGDSECCRRSQLFVSNSRTRGRGRKLCDFVGDR